MDYNTQRKRLRLPEYGRHIQQMVDHIASIEDREERNRLAKSLIAIMGNLNPQLRAVNNFRHKLWDHLFVMSDFNLDIDSPYPRPDMEKYNEKPRRVPYPSHPINFKYYGRIIELMIEKAIEMDEGPEKEAFKHLIANQMKKANISWNKESVTDDDIFRDMEHLSKGRLVMAPGSKLIDKREVKPVNSGKRSRHHRKR